MGEQIHISKNEIGRRPLFLKEIDDGVDGGIPVNQFTLLSGKRGSMKTSFSLFSAIHNVIQRREVTLFVSLDQSFASLHNQILSLGLPIKDVSIVHLQDLNEFEKDINKIHAYQDVGCLIVIDRRTIEKVAPFPSEESVSWLNVMKNLVRKIRSEVRLNTVILDSENYLREISLFKNPFRYYLELKEFFVDRSISFWMLFDDEDFTEEVKQSRKALSLLADSHLELTHNTYHRKTILELRILRMLHTNHSLDTHTLVFEKGSFFVRDSGETPLLR